MRCARPTQQPHLCELACNSCFKSVSNLPVTPTFACARRVRRTAKIITNQRNIQSNVSLSFQPSGTFFSAARCTARTVTVTGRFKQSGLCSTSEPTVKRGAWSQTHSIISTPTAPEAKVSGAPVTPSNLACVNSRAVSVSRAWAAYLPAPRPLMRAGCGARPTYYKPTQRPRWHFRSHSLQRRMVRRSPLRGLNHHCYGMLQMQWFTQHFRAHGAAGYKALKHWTMHRCREMASSRCNTTRTIFRAERGAGKGASRASRRCLLWRYCALFRLLRIAAAIGLLCACLQDRQPPGPG